MSERPEAPCELHKLRRCSWLRCERCTALKGDLGDDVLWLCISCVTSYGVTPQPYYADRVCDVCRTPSLLVLAVSTPRGD
jgi:hypothetical protein